MQAMRLMFQKISNCYCVRFPLQRRDPIPYYKQYRSWGENLGDVLVPQGTEVNATKGVFNDGHGFS
jgi:hypothetical protein